MVSTSGPRLHPTFADDFKHLKSLHRAHLQERRLQHVCHHAQTDKTGDEEYSVHGSLNCHDKIDTGHSEQPRPHGLMGSSTSGYNNKHPPTLPWLAYSEGDESTLSDSTEGLVPTSDSKLTLKHTRPG